MGKILVHSCVATASGRNKGWWYESSIAGSVIEANSVKDLKVKLEELIKEKDYINNKRLKFEPMYVDTIQGEIKQVGYTCTVNVDVQGNDYKWKTGYFRLWIRLVELNEVDFKEVA